MTTHVHFVGSIGLDTVDDVFGSVGAELKSRLKRCPAGRVAAGAGGDGWPQVARERRRQDRKV